LIAPWNEKCVYTIKEFVRPKMSLNSREFLVWGAREREGQAGGASQQADKLVVRIGLGDIER
jgi:hypothetical protein